MGPADAPPAAGLPFLDPCYTAHHIHLDPEWFVFGQTLMSRTGDEGSRYRRRGLKFAVAARVRRPAGFARADRGLMCPRP